MEIRLVKFTIGKGSVYINPSQVTAVRIIDGGALIEISSGTQYAVDESELSVINQLEG